LLQVHYCMKRDMSKCVQHRERTSRRQESNIVVRLLSTTTTTTTMTTTKTSGRPSSSFYFWKSPVGLDHHTVVGLVIRTTARAIYGRVATRGHFAEFHYVVERHWATPFGITLFLRASVRFFFFMKPHFPLLSLYSCVKYTRF